MKNKYKIGIAQCPKCKTHRAFYTTKPNTYVSKCHNCNKNTKIKDKKRGGFRLKLYWLKTNKMITAQKTASTLNERNSPRHQNVIKKELRKPPHRRRKIETLLQDIQPSKEFKTYTI